MSFTLLSNQAVLDAVEARASLHSIDTTSDAVATVDLARYYALIEADLTALETRFSASERMAVIAVHQNARFGPIQDIWMIAARVEDGLRLERLAEQHDLHEAAFLTKVASLTKSEMVAFVDAAGRWWNAVASEREPESGDLFVGIKRPR